VSPNSANEKDVKHDAIGAKIAAHAADLAKARLNSARAEADLRV
jgi:thiamine biosynthesis protein ThiC